MCNRLSELGFQVEQQEYTDQQGVLKILSCGVRRAVRSAPGARPLGYFCHNDVVSVAGWDCSHGGPFEGVLAEDRLWGRGSCDMKGSAATAMAAISRISAKEQTAPIYFFITGDEECGMEGAKLVGQSALFEELSAEQGVGIVGEPTELQVVNSHKGGYHFEVAANGVAAHSSTVDGLNANWKLIPFLSYLRQVQQRCLQDPELQNSEFDPPHLSLNPVVINRPVATNITVGQAICRIFLRPMPATEWEGLVDEILATAREMQLELKLAPVMPPVHTDAGRPFVQDTMEKTGQEEPLRVCYATDGCFYNDLEDLIVLGPGSIEQAHRVDEYIALDQLQRGTDLFEQLLRRYCA